LAVSKKTAANIAVIVSLLFVNRRL